MTKRYISGKAFLDQVAALPPGMFDGAFDGIDPNDDDPTLAIVDPLTGGEDTVEDGDPTPWLGPSDLEWYRNGPVAGG